MFTAIHYVGEWINRRTRRAYLKERPAAWVYHYSQSWRRYRERFPLPDNCEPVEVTLTLELEDSGDIPVVDFPIAADADCIHPVDYWLSLPKRNE